MKDYGHNITESKLRVGGSAVQVRKINLKKNVYSFSGFEAIFVDPQTGIIEANADFRKRGTVDGF